jgi:phenylacetate-coenzyme A ligase PaaK-like adenylate-forming protein
MATSIRDLALSVLYDTWAGQQAFVDRYGTGQPVSSLKEFLVHIQEHVPYYQARKRLYGASMKLEDFPVISRADIMDNPKDFFSSCLDTEVIKYTSGTTNLQLPVRYDSASWYDVNIGSYSYLRPFFESTGIHFEPGELGVVAITFKNERERVALWMPSLNLSLYERYLFGSNGVNDISLIRSLRECNIPVLHGKPHYLRKLVNLDRMEQGGRIQCSMILTSGETLYNDDVEEFNNWFNCPIIDAYVSSEGGLIGTRYTNQLEFDVCSSRIILEVLSDKGKVFSEGNGEILLTNPGNWAMVFLRYSTGDKGTLIQTPNGSIRLKLIAKETDIVLLGSYTIKIETINKFFQRLGIWDFQIQIQTTQEALCYWSPSLVSAPKEQVDREIHAFFRTRAPSVDVDVIMVKILTPLGGKRIRYPNSHFVS